ncbi:amidohydrolase family protein [Deferribacteres bacterium DY0037]
MKIIDSEIHILHPEACKASFAKYSEEPVVQAVHMHKDFDAVRDMMSFKALDSSMRKNNIANGLLMGLSWLDAGIQRENNDYIKELVKADRRFKGLYIPNLSDIKQAVREIELLDESTFIGIELLPTWQGVHINDTELQPVVDAVTARDMFMMVHTHHMTQTATGDTPSRFFSFTAANPDLKIIAQHMGGLVCLYAEIPHIKEILKNVTYITSVSSTMRFVEFAAEICNSNIVFGTDFPFNHCHDQSTQIRYIQNSGMSDAAKENILYKTAERLFGFGASV